MSHRVLGDDDEAGGLFVEAVRQAGADGRRRRLSDGETPGRRDFDLSIAACLRRRVSVQIIGKGIQHRPVILAVRRVDEHSGRLVDNDDVFILENDVERNVVGLHRRFAGHIDGDLDEVVRAKAIADILPPTIHLASSAFDDIAKIHLAQAAEMIEKKILEPHFLVLGGGLYNDLLFHSYIVS